jgi:hypothetical protein
MLEGVYATGEATWSEAPLLILHRNLLQEEAYFTFFCSPIRDDNGRSTLPWCSISAGTR